MSWDRTLFTTLGFKWHHGCAMRNFTFGRGGCTKVSALMMQVSLSSLPGSRALSSGSPTASTMDQELTTAEAKNSEQGMQMRVQTLQMLQAQTSQNLKLWANGKATSTKLRTIGQLPKLLQRDAQKRGCTPRVSRRLGTVQLYNDAYIMTATESTSRGQTDGGGRITRPSWHAKLQVTRLLRLKGTRWQANSHQPSICSSSIHLQHLTTP